ncbi:polyprenyl synthetase family protein [Desulfobulbus oligotrophicus]|uniref:Polyprenyl synthetase family protein n=1 Tax=Desulfobulbus oligotrophicus TaxID=1909699 RepID=A0A7T5VAS2_9BACT|nr:farnesyl diphosphate synthase [Desulfobulbus oligotrophicus]MDY0391467.1 polyprenyl synthetase family protein [Desulfobulbus oligotrophicus]QQG64361.1 polyprenyl synthetase family protein [Desulfobulbus oligotrophicus]
MEIRIYLDEQRQLVEERLARYMLEPIGVFSQHIEAMRYSLFAGGKRIRPILCLAGAAAINSSENTRNLAMPVACAFEFIHTYSLIHDDLPAMDDDDLRRGKPTNHTVFGEAAAILAGDGLLTLAFELVSGPAATGIADKSRLRLIHTIAGAAGSLGMVGGQSLDMIHAGEQIGYDELRHIHQSKTGALITASVVCGGIVAGADEKQERALKAYGDNIGLAFQIVDDLLDIMATTAELGKSAGSDIKSDKVTYPSLFGVETSHTMAKEAVQEAVAALAPFDRQADPLRALAHYIVDRKK